MPYKSEAQRRKLHELASQGKIDKKVVDEFDKASRGKDLPERVMPKKIKSLKDLKTVAKLKIK